MHEYIVVDVHPLIISKEAKLVLSRFQNQLHVVNCSIDVVTCKFEYKYQREVIAASVSF